MPGVGLGQKHRWHLGDLQGVGDAVVGSGICKARHGAAIHADGHHLDAVARLESRQRGGEGVAVRAVTAEEKEQDVVLAQRGDRLGSAEQLVPVEHLQRLGVDWAAMYGGVQLRCGPGDALGDVGEVGRSGHNLGLQFHVAAHIGLGRPHDRNVAVGLDSLLQSLEFDQLWRSGRAG